MELSDAATAPRLRWTVWPLVDRPLTSIAVLVGLISSGYLIWLTGVAWYWGLAASLALAVAMWRYWLPVTFEVSLRGLKQESLFQNARTVWPDIQAVRRCASGMLLLPSMDDSPLDAMRGLFLPWGPHKAELQQLISLYLTGEDYDA